MTPRSLAIPSLLFLAVSQPSCGSSTPPSAREVRFAQHPGGRAVTQEELQQDVQRFAGYLLSRLADTVQPLVESPSADIREDVMRLFLRDYSATLDIATGPIPELDLLDMAIFVRLSRGVFERHWLDVYGDRGKEVADVWRTADTRLGVTTSKVLDDEQRARLRGLADEWLRANPDAVDVEDVRLSEFSEVAGKASAMNAAESRGLFGAVKAATQEGDEALMLGERFRFIATRAPTLVRVQARLGASEVTSDALKRVGELRVEEMPPGSEAKGLIEEMRALVKDGRKIEHEATTMVTAFQPLTQYVGRPENVSSLLSHVESLDNETSVVLQRADRLLGEVQRFVPPDSKSMQATLSATEKRVDVLARRVLAYVAVIGAAWTVLFWAGYVLAKRTVAQRKPHE